MENDPRRDCHRDVIGFSNSHSAERRVGDGCEHPMKPTDPEDMVHWDGVVHMDGALGGSK